MRPGSRSLLFAVVMGAAVTPVALAEPALAAPAVCERFDRLPEQPPAQGGAQDALIAAANELAVDGQLDAADRLYLLALRREPGDARAATGLVYDRARRLMAQKVVDEAQRLDEVRHADTDATPGRARAAAKAVEDCFEQARLLDGDNEPASEGPSDAPQDKTFAAIAADRWDAFYVAWIEPAGRALLPLLAALATLFVLARLVTPVVVSVDALAWPTGRRRVAWWTGLLLFAAIALRWAQVRPEWRIADPSWPLKLGAVLVVLAAAGGVVALSRSRPPPDANTARGSWVALAVLVVLAGGAGWLVTRADDTGWLFCIGVPVAVLGAAFQAAGRGHALRLQVSVKNGESKDPSGSSFVLGALQQLGSAPPRGVKAPQQVDVVDLPSTALSALPAGKVASALASTLNLLSPSVPWRATVEDVPGGQLVVTLTRNGSVAESTVIDPTQFRWNRDEEPAEDGTSSAGTGLDREALLIAAAAVVLTQLSERHIALKAGLCGATHWASVAAHVVATKPGFDDQNLKRELLAYAVKRDPGNALARAAYIAQLGESASTAEELRSHAGRLEELRDGVIEQHGGAPRGTGQGYTALRLRTAHSLTATWLNVVVDEQNNPPSPPATPDAWRRASSAFEQLLGLFEEEEVKRMGERQTRAFVRELRAVATELYAAFGALTHTGHDLPDPPTATSDPLAFSSLQVMYDEACRLAQAPGTRRQAFASLEFAAGSEELRRAARNDPWFAKLRDEDGENDDEQRRFWEIVGEPAPAPSFVDLPYFGTGGQVLRSLGIGSAADLRAVTGRRAGRAELARQADVPLLVVGRWRRLAVLAAPRGARRSDVGTRDLELLLAVGVSTRGQLLRRTRGGWQRGSLLKAVRDQARSRQIPPPRDNDVRRWLGWAG